MTICKEHLDLFASKLNSIKDLVIIPHKDPDGDAIGACLAWYNVLVAKGVNVAVVSPNDVPITFKWMIGSQQIINYSVSESIADELIRKAQLIIFLDFNALSRLGKIKDVISELNTDRVMIDHHPYPEENIAQIKFSDVTVSSTCELSYNVIEALRYDICKDAAECLYTGIMTDTGLLNHNSSRANIYRVVASLIDIGIDKEKIHREVFHSNSISRMRLLGYSLSKKMQFLLNGKIALITLSNQELVDFDYKPGDTEGLVNYPLSIEGIEISVLITEKTKGIVKLSFRSRGDVAVNKYSEKYFSGGGHMNAAGGEYKGALTDSINLLTETIEPFFSDKYY